MIYFITSGARCQERHVVACVIIYSSAKIYSNNGIVLPVQLGTRSGGSGLWVLDMQAQPQQPTLVTVLVAAIASTPRQDLVLALSEYTNLHNHA